jgi:hypothetical protein
VIVLIPILSALPSNEFVLPYSVGRKEGAGEVTMPVKGMKSWLEDWFIGAPG